MRWSQTSINRSAQVVAAFEPISRCSSGSLSLTAASTLSFPAVTLNGSDQTQTASLVVTPDDETGSNAGWNITGTSTTFTKSGGRTLPTTATTLTAASAAAASGNCSLPTNSLSYPITLPAGAGAPTAVKLYNASAYRAAVVERRR